MRKFINLLLLAALSLALLVGCSVEGKSESSDSGSNPYFFYYINKDETELVQGSYVPEDETAQTMLKELVTMLNDRDSSGDSQALLPKEVEIQSFEINDATLNLVFGSQYSSMGRTREILVRAGIVRIMLQVPGISGVKFFVGSSELTDSKGNALGVMDSSSFVELWGDEKDAYRHDTFTLYFTDSTGENLVAETRSVYYKRNLPRERVILEQLVKGPMVKGHYPTLPENTEVLDVLNADRVCYVDFSQAFTESMLDLPEKTVIYSVANSLLATIDADKVQIRVDGQNDASLGEDTSLYNFFGWNADLIIAEE